MTVCLILAIFLGTSASQPIAPEDSMNQGPLAIPQAVSLPDQTTVQQQFKEQASSSDTKHPKKLGKRGILKSTAEHGTKLLVKPKILFSCSGTIIKTVKILKNSEHN